MYSLLSMLPQRDMGEYCSRVYPRASGISLSDTTRTASGDYILDSAAGYIRNSAAETSIGRCDRVVSFDVTMPTSSNSTYIQQVYAADTLFDKALKWLQQHDSIATTYTAIVTGYDEPIRPGETIHIITSITVDGSVIVNIDDDFNILSVSNSLSEGGIPIATLELSTIERPPDTDARIMAGSIASASRQSYQASTIATRTIQTTVTSQVSHNDLTDVTANQHHDSFTQADHTAIGTASPHHESFVLADHLAIGDAAPHHSAVTAGNGITVSGQQVSIDGTDNVTWTGNQIFQGNNTYRDLIPEAADTYDIGDVTTYWRNQYVSQIMATIFAENTMQLIGGSFMIPKSTGVLPAVGSADTSIDFDNTMTVGDHILIKSYNTAGSACTEYMAIGTVISGTTYAVTRDEAGAYSPNPAWPDGTPYAVLGQDGNGWIVLDATTTPRMSIISLGTVYNDQDEVVRLGDLNGLADYASETYGLYLGGLATGAYLTADAENGLRISSPNGEFTIGKDGIQLEAPDTYDAGAAIRWIDGSDNLSSRIYTLVGAEFSIGEDIFYSGHNILLEASEIAATPSQVALRSEAPTSELARVSMVARSGDEILFAELTDEDDGTAAFNLGYYTGSAFTGTVTIAPKTGKITKSTGLGALVYKDSDTTTTNGDYSTYLTFNQEVRDNDGIHSTATNTDRLTAQHAGWYYVYGCIKWEANGTGKREAVIVASTGMTATQSTPALASNTLTQNVSLLVYLDAADYVRLRYYQNSGGDLDIVYGSNNSPYFGMVRIA